MVHCSWGRQSVEVTFCRGCELDQRAAASGVIQGIVLKRMAEIDALINRVSVVRAAANRRNVYLSERLAAETIGQQLNTQGFARLFKLGIFKTS
mmetsp:Transcript_31925/g.46733  ORF Transcript_31925/g.46733 Transcript_31925/m.46733 type:complete len:94 (-) Transcript_31925:192-473(-)